MAATLACCPTVAQSNPETGARIPHLNRLILLLLVLFWRMAWALSGRSRRIGHRGIQWCRRTDLASAIVTKQVSESSQPLILWVGQRFNWRLGFYDVPFGLSFLFPHCPGDNTARPKILDRAPHRDCQQLDRLCNCIANVTAWLYSSKPVLHLHIRVQHTVVAQGTHTHTSRSGAATGY